MRLPIHTLVIRADERGHYLARGSIDGHPVRFLVDTGATGIAVPAELAQRLRLPRGDSAQVSTANGPAEVYRTRLGDLRVGGLSRRNVEAHVNPGLSGEVLLGMAFLQGYRLKQANGRLHIQSVRPNRWLEHCGSHGLVALLAAIGADSLGRLAYAGWQPLQRFMTEATFWLTLQSGFRIGPATWQAAAIALATGITWGAAFWMLTIRPDMGEQR